jgi:peptidyl-prolyl cis-trans isomerase C
MIRTRSALALAALLAAAPMFAGPAHAQADKVVARVDGMPITEGELMLAEEELTERMRQVPPPQRRDFLVGYVADLKMGARAAERAKVGEGAEFTQRLAFARSKLLMEQFIAVEAKKAVTPEAARKLFDDTMKTMQPESEVRARHILVEKEEEAKAALERVRKGEDFAKVAAELSKDPGSGQQGGDLGFFTQERMVPPFAEAAFKLKPGEISEPVQTQFGWHVIKVEERRERPLPSFEEVKAEIDQYLLRRAQQEIVLNLRKDMKLERLP